MKPAAQRSNNRNDALLDASAELFSTQGFRETTMRDIAKSAGMLPGSIYYHYGSKDDLLLAVYEAGVDRIVEEFNEAVDTVDDPARRLEVAISTHIGAITRETPYMRVINRVLPEHVPKHAAALSHLRQRYEECFRNLIEDLPLSPFVDRSLLRLMVLGAVNHTQFWFDPNRKQTPEDIGKAFAGFLIEPIAAPSKSRTPSKRKTSK